MKLLCLVYVTNSSNEVLGLVDIGWAKVCNENKRENENQFKGLNVHALVFGDGSNNSTLFGFGDIIGFQKSNDKGITWIKVNTNNLNDTITNIVMDPDMDFIYVSGYSEKGFLSFYKSSDGGLTWVLIGTNKEPDAK
jgi:hypothetical protein